MSLQILHLTLKKKWFDLIASGKKKVEYREIKPYWISRLHYHCSNAEGMFEREFDEIHFRNGYRKDSHFMRVEWKGLEREKFEGKEYFAIKLGKILEISQ